MSDNFNVFLPVDDIEQEEHGVFLRGYATTTDKDLQGEIVLPCELDISEFLAKGFINYEHRQGSENAVGYPTKNTRIDKKGLYVECKLWVNTPRGREVWEHAKTVAKSGDRAKLGFSIEGKKQYRDPSTGVLYGITVTNVAVTTNPANPNATYEAFMKSLTTGYENGNLDQTDGAALRVTNLSVKLTNLAYELQDLTVKDWCAIAESLDEEERYSPTVGALFLQLRDGVSRDDAVKRAHVE